MRYLQEYKCVCCYSKILELYAVYSSLIVTDMTKEMHIEKDIIWRTVKENVVAFGEIGVLWSYVLWRRALARYKERLGDFQIVQLYTSRGKFREGKRG